MTHIILMVVIALVAFWLGTIWAARGWSGWMAIAMELSKEKRALKTVLLDGCNGAIHDDDPEWWARVYALLPAEATSVNAKKDGNE